MYLWEETQLNKKATVVTVQSVILLRQYCIMSKSGIAF